MRSGFVVQVCAVAGMKWLLVARVRIVDQSVNIT